MCSHIIILAVTLKLVEFPQASMQIPIGQNRKRGRSNKTKKALVRQNENNSLSPPGLEITDVLTRFYGLFL
jgi:hypothetical protein